MIAGLAVVAVIAVGTSLVAARFWQAANLARLKAEKSEARAQEEAARADEQKHLAERSEARAQEEAARANEQKRLAEANLVKAEKAEREATIRADTSNFLMAMAAYDNRDVSGALNRLDGIQARSRGWEWHYLRRLWTGGIFTLYGHTGVVTGVAFSPDGTRIATAVITIPRGCGTPQSGMPLLELKGPTGLGE